MPSRAVRPRACWPASVLPSRRNRASTASCGRSMRCLLAGWPHWHHWSARPPGRATRSPSVSSTRPHRCWSRHSHGWVPGRRTPSSCWPAAWQPSRACSAVEAHPGIDGLLRAVYAMPPRGMATLAPLVGEAAGQGDPVAERILDEATQVLVETLARLGPGPEDTVVVLAGGVATEQSMLSGRLEQAVTARWGLPVTYGLSGAWGAVRIAHRDLAARLD